MEYAIWPVLILILCFFLGGGIEYTEKLTDQYHTRKMAKLQFEKEQARRRRLSS